VSVADRDQAEIVDVLAGLAVFADLTKPQLEAVAHTFEEEWFSDGQRIIRQGFGGTGFFVLVDGQVAVAIDGEERARLSRGEFFGEISLLLGEDPVADIVAVGPVRCLTLSGPELESFLVTYPRVMYRMLQTVARRLRAANRWRNQ
jgi:CRP/FNR family transcriptional regulator, cyclic AMP receptor protein